MTAYRKIIDCSDLLPDGEDIQQGLGRMFPYPITSVQDGPTAHLGCNVRRLLVRMTQNYHVTVSTDNLDSVCFK